MKLTDLVSPAITPTYLSKNVVPIMFYCTLLASLVGRSHKKQDEAKKPSLRMFQLYAVIFIRGNKLIFVEIVLSQLVSSGKCYISSIG